MLERSLSKNSITAYTADVEKLASYSNTQIDAGPLTVTQDHAEQFLGFLHEIGISARSQARILSGLKAYYKYLILEGIIKQSPLELIEGPRLRKVTVIRQSSKSSMPVVSGSQSWSLSSCPTSTMTSAMSKSSVRTIRNESSPSPTTQSMWSGSTPNTNASRSMSNPGILTLSSSIGGVRHLAG